MVIFFNSFERLFCSLSYLLASKNGSLFLQGPCQIFVVFYLAFSFNRVVDLTVAEHHPDKILKNPMF